MSIVDLVSVDAWLGAVLLPVGRLYAGLSLIGREKLVAAPMRSAVK